MEAKKIFTQRNKPILTEMKNHPCFPKPPEFAGMVWLTVIFSSSFIVVFTGNHPYMD